MEDWKKQAIVWASKWWTYFLYFGLGLIGKFSYGIYRKKTFSFLYVTASIGIACFVGFLVCIACIKYCPNYTAFLVPIATMFSDKIIMWMGALDWRKILDKLYVSFVK